MILKKTNASKYQIIAVNFVTSLDKQSIINLILLNISSMGFNKYIVFLLYLLIFI